jgi:hypothetical protein
MWRTRLAYDGFFEIRQHASRVRHNRVQTGPLREMKPPLIRHKGGGYCRSLANNSAQSRQWLLIVLTTG